MQKSFREELQKIIPTEFSDESRVWVFQSNRAFIEKEADEINEQLHQFYAQWLTHGDKVQGWAKLVFGQFILVMADEEKYNVSGCSTDSMMRIIKSLERQYEVNFFERTLLTFLVKGKAEMLPMNQVVYALEKQYITGDTPLFNNLVQTKKELMNSWLMPLKQTWLGKKLILSEASDN